MYFCPSITPSSIELADGRVLLLNRTWRNRRTEVQATFNDGRTISGDNVFSFVGETSQAFESSSTVFNTFYANLSDIQQEVRTVGTYATPQIDTIYSDTIFQYDNNVENLPSVSYETGRTNESRTLLEEGTIHLPAQDTAVVTIKVDDSGGVPTIGDLGFIDFGSATTSSGRIILDSYLISDGNVHRKRSRTQSTGVTAPPIEVFVSRIDETTVQVTFANTDNKDWLCYRYTIESGVVTNSTTTRLKLPDDGSNIQSVRKYGVQEYPQEPTFLVQGVLDNPCLLYTSPSPRDS